MPPRRRTRKVSIRRRFTCSLQLLCFSPFHFPTLSHLFSFCFTRYSQVGLKRIDAALDALRPMGFPDNLVRKTVRELLKTYGGDEGWTFIEEASYRVLIDTIIEGYEKSEQENAERKSSMENCSPKDEVMEDEPGVQVHSSPDHSMHVESPQSHFSSPKDIKTCSLNDDDSFRDKFGAQVHSPQVHSAQVSSPHINPQPVMDIIPFSTKDDSSQGKLGRIQLHSPQISSSATCSPHMFSPPPVEYYPVRRRKPCYGWISSDDEEDLVHLTPAK